MVLVSLLLAACATVATAGEPGDHPGLSPQAQAKHDSFAPKARVAFGKFELHYFGARGKAETVRLLLNDQKLDYEEVRYARPIDGHLGPNLKDWTVEKAKGIASGLMPFGRESAANPARCEPCLSARLLGDPLLPLPAATLVPLPPPPCIYATLTQLPAYLRLPTQRCRPSATPSELEAWSMEPATLLSRRLSRRAARS